MLQIRGDANFGEKPIYAEDSAEFGIEEFEHSGTVLALAPITTSDANPPHANCHARR